MDLTNLSHESLDGFMEKLLGTLDGMDSVEAACINLSRSMYEQCIHQGAQSLVLSRVFRSIAFDQLPAEIKEAADQAVGGSAKDEDRFLVLLGTWGKEDAWRDRKSSAGHKAIPLDPSVVKTIPMLSRAIQQIGLDLGIETESKDPSGLGIAGVSGAFGVFHVETAPHSQYIPAQEGFVIPYGVQSVLGSGARLPNGEIALYISFSCHTIPESSAVYFSSMMVEFCRRIQALSTHVFS